MFLFKTRFRVFLSLSKFCHFLSNLNDIGSYIITFRKLRAWVERERNGGNLSVPYVTKRNDDDNDDESCLVYLIIVLKEIQDDCLT